MVRAAATLRFDTTAFVGVQPSEFDSLSMQGLHADLEKDDRVVVDTSLCFERPKPVQTFNGVLTTIDMVTQQNDAAFQGMEFMVVRPGKQTGVFEVKEVQYAPIF